MLTLTVWPRFGAGFVVAKVLPSPVVARLSGLWELPIDSHLSGKLQFRPVLTRELPLNTFGGWNMKKLLGIALAGMLISTAACGPKAQAGGDTTKIAPPAGGAAPAGGAPAGGAPAGTDPAANPGSAPAPVG